LTLTKLTSRYKFNKMISMSRLENIHFAIDVTPDTLDEVIAELKEQMSENNHSITFVCAFENRSPRGVL